MPSQSVARLAIPAVLLLIVFLGYTSQYLLAFLDPRPLSKDEIVKFNILLACILICYYRACTADPGRLPRSPPPSSDTKLSDTPAAEPRQRWCRKCDAPKWPRAHHCRTCGRCIPKMDHHCPWTVNCVSHTTYPHFIRFVLYAVISMGYLWKLLWPRDTILWENRNKPSYLGPSVAQLVHLLLLNIANFLTFFALFILLARSLWNLAINQTTIENWEVERHETLLRRSRYLGGFLDGPDGSRIKIVRQEFPYDIGIFKNIAQGMNSRNPLMWILPLAATPHSNSGISFETNGFEDPALSWPPPDPDRLTRRPVVPDSPAFTHEEGSSEQERIDAFRRRQEQDIQRWQQTDGSVRKRKAFHKRYDANSELLTSDMTADDDESGEEGWRNHEGERLNDFGVDEDAEFYDEENIPLAQLIERRKAAKQRHND